MRLLMNSTVHTTATRLCCSVCVRCVSAVNYFTRRCCRRRCWHSQGDYVVLASEGHCICGVDVAAPSQLRRPGSKRSLVDTIQLLKGQLSADEVGFGVL